MTSDLDQPPRICRTPAEAFAAGWDDGATDRPPTASETNRVAALWRPYYQPATADTA